MASNRTSAQANQGNNSLHLSSSPFANLLQLDLPTIRAKSQSELNAILKFMWENGNPDYTKAVCHVLDAFSQANRERAPKPQMIQAELATLENQTHAKRSALLRVFSRFGSEVNSSWMKMTASKRALLLREIHPTIPATHRPDLHAFRQARRAAFQLPFSNEEILNHVNINMEDLCSETIMIEFVRSRTTHPVHIFTHSHIHTSAFGYFSNCRALPASIEGYQLVRYRTSETYFRLHKLQDGAGTSNMDPGLGLAALKCHGEELGFIGEFLHKLLPDLLMRQVGHPTGQFNPAPESSYNDVETSVRSLSRRTAYRVPQNLDFDEHLSLLEAARFSCQFDMRSLRNDPNVFWQSLEDYNEQLSSAISPKPKGFWAHQIACMVADRYMTLVYLEGAYARAKLLFSLVKQDGSNFLTRTSLSPTMMEALIKYVCVLSRCSLNLTDRFNESVKESPKFRHGYVKLPGGKTEFRRNGRDYDPLCDLLRELDDPDWLVGCEVGVRDVIDAIDSHFEENPHTVNMLSPVTMHFLGKLGLISFLERDTKSFEPWASNMSLSSQRHGAAVQTAWCKQEVKIANFKKALERMRLPTSWEPSSCQFERSDSLDTEEATILTIKAEECLDEVWQFVEKIILSCIGKSFASVFEKNLPAATQASKTSPWTASASSSAVILRMEVDCVPTSYDEADHANHGATSDNTEVATSTKPRKMLFLRPAKVNALAAQNAKKLKRKTKKPDDQIPPAVDPRSKPIFPVSKQSLAVFHTMLFVPGRKGFKNVSWTEFCYAMVEIDFNICNLSAGGSAVSFNPDPKRTSLKGSLVLHSPHGHDPPDSLLYKVAHKQWGAPLASRWDLGFDNFVLK